MAPTADVYIAIDRTKPLSQEPHTGHNRWHPDIPPVATVEPGQVVGLETRDAFDGQLQPDSGVEDVGRINLDLVHPLTGPIFVNGAEPGDLLEVTIHDIEPQPFGFTVQAVGFGFLRDLFPQPHIVRWTIADGAATSEDLPGVRIPGAPFMGVMGLAPSHELLERINSRETALAGRGGMVLLPETAGAIPADSGLAGRAMRTIAPHETGGNVDIKQLTAGTLLRIPVYVPAACFRLATRISPRATVSVAARRWKWRRPVTVLSVCSNRSRPSVRSTTCSSRAASTSPRPRWPHPGAFLPPPASVRPATARPGRGRQPGGQERAAEHDRSSDGRVRLHPPAGLRHLQCGGRSEDQRSGGRAELCGVGLFAARHF